MKAGGIGSVRWPVNWATVQPTKKGGYDWSSVDPAVAAAARRGLTVLPFLYGTPRWIASKPTTLPVDSGRARKAWLAFVDAAVERYGPGGEFWDGARAQPGGGQLRAGGAAAGADPHLADLERGQLLLLRLPGLAQPLRAAAEARPTGRSRPPTRPPK